MTDGPNWQSSLKDASPYLTIGIQLAGSMLFYVGVGYFMDKWLDTTPWLLVTGSVVGMAAFFIQLVRIAKEVEGNEDDQDVGSDGPPNLAD
ncbi:MAG: AtpZ/AtpI family protein [Bacteroidetes Order II. Incertae sedis bacterium]|nr:AtpZ/AtpI family protein [Bacteroidetes Order II. bacterium]MDG1755234.1 AtpZ/AtpI family protein [Rhodothermales bacterium]HAY36940.1 hypothetical protein [Bacteroidota bacterium]MBT4053236.1 AtpZ/AtpI family protein [Bacteroidetes Order II. bacterium]MBT4603528.1 AtpZ/AtpI family protein [Bacteroidetes Order II. bacterium]